MIRRTLKKKPSLVKNKTGKRKNTKGIKRNRRKVHKTRKRKGGGRTPLTNLVDPAARLFYKGLYNAGQAARYIKEKLKKMPKNTRNKYRALRYYIEQQNEKRRETYKGGEKEEGENIEDLIENIVDGDDGVSDCDHIKTLTHFREIAENEETKTALTEKISELEKKGNCENTTIEPSAGSSETSSGSAELSATEEQEPTQEV